MHSNVAIKNVSWLQFSRATLYLVTRGPYLSSCFILRNFAIASHYHCYSERIRGNERNYTRLCNLYSPTSFHSYTCNLYRSICLSSPLNLVRISRYLGLLYNFLGQLQYVLYMYYYSVINRKDYYKQNSSPESLFSCRSVAIGS